MNWMNMFGNPLQQSIKKYVYELIGPERYAPHEPVLEVIARNVHNPAEFDGLGKFIAEVYEAGYVRAVEEHRKELERLGLKATIKKVENISNVQPIFNRKNPSGSQ